MFQNAFDESYKELFSRIIPNLTVEGFDLDLIALHGSVLAQAGRGAIGVGAGRPTRGTHRLRRCVGPERDDAGV